eukprot:TRINITY_DN3966_c0_g1_i2.p1 TRINITY_DN3966_c0_g1~~TRINITY_DN3966_c0_g1_i2.p1  ORF type:complete len:1265 (+),score=154.20 TRINITY_DN3966_c0_g1_i2:55-3849(+)
MSPTVWSDDRKLSWGQHKVIASAEATEEGHWRRQHGTKGRQPKTDATGAHLTKRKRHKKLATSRSFDELTIDELTIDELNIDELEDMRGGGGLATFPYCVRRAAKPMRKVIDRKVLAKMSSFSLTLCKKIIKSHNLGTAVSRSLERAYDRDTKSEKTSTGLYRPFRKGTLYAPWVYSPSSWERTRRIMRNPRWGFIAESRRPAIGPPRAVSSSETPVVAVADPEGHPSLVDAVKPGLSPPGSAWTVLGAAPPTEWPCTEEITEEDTAELSRWAAEEADLCLLPNGAIDTRRLRRVLLGAEPRLARLVLSRMPYAELRLLAGSSDVASRGLPCFTVNILSGDVVNSALIAAERRCRAAWLRRPLPPEVYDSHGDLISSPSIAPPVGLDMLCARRVFSADGSMLVEVSQRNLDKDEHLHPRVEGGRDAAGLVVVPSLAAFRILLSSFTDGLSDVIPFGDGVVLGGSACFACFALRRAVLQEHENSINHAVGLYFCAGTLRRTLATAMRWGAGLRPAVDLIFQFLGDPRLAARTSLKPVVKNMFRTGSPYAGADIDVFITATSKQAAADALEKTRCRIAKYMDSRSAEACCFVQTPNSVTVCGCPPYRRVQLVTKVAETISELLSFVDLPCTGYIYDGVTLWATDHALLSLEIGYQLLSTHQIRCRGDYLRRVAKYAKRGCGMLVYELCRHEPRCDVKLDHQTQRCLELMRKQVDAPRRTRPSPQESLDEDYDDIDLPSGTPSNILASIPLGKHGWEIVVPTSCATWWLPLLEWRRERTSSLRRKFGLGGSNDQARCYMCDAPQQKPSDATPAAATESPSGREDTASVEAKDRLQTRVVVCGSCVARNAQGRNDRENLSGYTAIVTGGRCKVGYETCLMLLRCGAFVVTSTRFPSCASERFSNELDSAEWAARLHIYGVDILHFYSLESFIKQIVDHYGVDILINNAAQTIRRPLAYYKDLLDKEKAIYERSRSAHTSAGEVMSREGSDIFVRELGADPWVLRTAPSSDANDHTMFSLSLESDIADAPLSLTRIRNELVSSVLPLLPTEKSDLTSLDSADAARHFPAARSDLHGEQLDLRTHTSWTTSLASPEGSITPLELLEVLAVNAAAPFILLQGLIPALISQLPAERDKRGRAGSKGVAAPSRAKVVVNVSSAEGVFSAEGAAAKSSAHPHSNMAKAALNMLTKTAATELGERGVQVVAVDPGWISMMQPGEPNSSERPLPPLSEADGAARVVAPVLDCVRALRAGRRPQHGVLLRNFVPAPW